MSSRTITNPDAEAVRLVECGKHRILSLDVFDTTVWRTVPAPTDLFYALGHRLSGSGLVRPSVSASTFASERIEAERRAREVLGKHGEVTLEEIYKCFPSGLLRSQEVSRALEAELELERESTFADPKIVELIDLAVARGLKIAFVSDTYFDAAHIEAIVPREGDYILLSSQYRCNKVQGLHKELIRRSGVPAEQILHIGDNLDADVRFPAKLGIQTLWRPRLPEPFIASVAEELPTNRSERAALFAGGGGDGSVSALRAQSVTEPETWPDAYRSWGSLFLGPLLGGFGKWVSERCQDEGIGTAFCLMREGRLLSKVLGHTAPELTAHEFFTSRYAMVSASIFEGSVPELAQFLARPLPTPAHELLSPLGITPEEVGLTDDVLVASGSVHHLAQKIAGRTKLQAKAREASARARQNFLRYLRDQFAELPERVAVVDLGYSGTIQNHLQAIFDYEGIPCKTHGLYFVTGSGIRKIQLKGLAAEGYMGDNGQPLSVSHSFMRSPELIEQCLMCPIGSTLSYAEDGQPVLGPQLLPASQLEQIAKIQAGALDFAQKFGALSPRQKRPAVALRPFLEAILIRSLTRPTKLELTLFGDWVHDENLGSTKTRKLIETNLEPEYLSHATAHQLASLSNATSYWIFGTAQAQHPLVGEAVRSIFLRKTSPQAFQCPEQDRKLFFFWNDGTAHRAESPYVLSNRRTAWSRFTIDSRNASLREIGFSVGDPGDVISVSSIVLRLHQSGRPVEVRRLPLSELETFGLEKLKGTNSAYLVTETAGFAAPVKGLEDFTGRIEVDLLFSQLPTGEPCLC